MTRSVISAKANALARLRELLAGRKERRRGRNQEGVILIAIDASLRIPNTSTGLRPLQDTLVGEREQQSNERVPLVAPATSKNVKRACTWGKVLSDSACSEIMKDPRKDMRDSRLDSFQSGHAIEFVEGVTDIESEEASVGAKIQISLNSLMESLACRLMTDGILQRCQRLRHNRSQHASLGTIDQLAEEIAKPQGSNLFRVIPIQSNEASGYIGLENWLRRFAQRQVAENVRTWGHACGWAGIQVQSSAGAFPRPAPRR